MHLDEAIASGIALTESAADSACFNKDSLSPGQTVESAVSPALVEQIRKSLGDVNSTRKSDILRHLDDAIARCAGH
jgi:hypothetical protein